MNSLKFSPLNSVRFFLFAAFAALASPALAQLVAYDDAGNYLVSGNWTNGANQGFGLTPWVITTNGPDFHGTYIGTSTNPPVFVIATTTNILGTNYACVWGTFANGPTDINETTAYRGFTNSLGTNTFKLQWGSAGAGVTTTANSGPVHGWCGFTLRNGNATNSTGDFQTGARLQVYFRDGNSPSTIYVGDGTGSPFGAVSVPNTSFSDLGRQTITNAIEAEVTPLADGNTYHLVLKDVVANRILYVHEGPLAGSGSIDSAALFCHETTGDQVYNKMQIALPRIPPTISNLQPADGSIYLDANSTTLSFEVDSLLSSVSSGTVTVTLNGVPQSGLTFNTTSPTNMLLVTNAATLAPDTFYNYVITAQDANGDTVSNLFTFNTFLATDFYIDAYDYNYTNGLFVDSPTPANAFVNFLGSNLVDYSIADTSGVNNTAGYRPGDLPEILSLATDATGDPIDHANLRANLHTAYNIGFTDTGNWENFTRTMPTATNYSIYARAASASGGQFEVELLANSTATTTNQPLIALGRVNVPNTGGSKVFSGQLQPVTDIFGNTVVVPLSGTRTLRQTSIASRVYNIEYFVLPVITNSLGTLRPYIATGSPGPNASGVSLTSPITFNIANRQTLVLTNTIQVFLNTTNITSRLLIVSNLAGTTVSWSPTNNLPASATNTVVVIFTDSSSTSITNTWNFFTGTTGGVLGNALWSGASGVDLNWATAANWIGGTPGPGFNATFASQGATNNPSTNNIVSVNTTIQGLFYNTNNSGYHTTLIADGVTLTVTNGSTSITPILQVGGLFNSDNNFNLKVTNTIVGPNAKLLVLGNSQSSGALNQLNFQIRQCANPPVPEQTVLDMSGLGTLIATVGKFYVAQGGSGTYQSNCSARVNLARTNVITCLRPNNAGAFEVGDSSGGNITLPGSTLNLGITNAFFVDTARFGKQKATNNLVRFNPIFTSGITPSVFIRGTNGLTSRVATWTIGDADTEATIPNFVQANVDLSGGKVDGLINVMVLGRGETSASDSGYAQGSLTLTAGTLDVNNVSNGVQRAASTATESGVINVNGSATLLSPNLVLAQLASGGTASLVTGNLNITNGTVRANVTAGGGISTINLSGGSLIASNTVGTPAYPLSALNLVGGSLHFKADGSASVTNIVATAITTSGTTTVAIDSVANVSSPTTLHLISYTGTDPYASLTLAPLPAGFGGGLVDNSANSLVDLIVSNTAPPPQPTIRKILISGPQVVLSGTNNSSTGGGTYKVLTSTNVVLPPSTWAVLTNGSFDSNGNFASTNAVGTNAQRFYRLQVP